MAFLVVSHNVSSCESLGWHDEDLRGMSLLQHPNHADKQITLLQGISRQAFEKLQQSKPNRYDCKYTAHLDCESDGIAIFYPTTRYTNPNSFTEIVSIDKTACFVDLWDKTLNKAIRVAHLHFHINRTDRNNPQDWLTKIIQSNKCFGIDYLILAGDFGKEQELLPLLGQDKFIEDQKGNDQMSRIFYKGIYGNLEDLILKRLCYVQDDKATKSLSNLVNIRDPAEDFVLVDATDNQTVENKPADPSLLGWIWSFWT